MINRISRISLITAMLVVPASAFAIDPEPAPPGSGGSEDGTTPVEAFPEGTGDEFEGPVHFCGGAAEDSVLLVADELVAEGAFEEARNAIKRAQRAGSLEVWERAPAEIALANIALHEENYRQALRHYERATRLDARTGAGATTEASAQFGYAIAEAGARRGGSAVTRARALGTQVCSDDYFDVGTCYAVHRIVGELGTDPTEVFEALRRADSLREEGASMASVLDEYDSMLREAMGAASPRRNGARPTRTAANATAAR